MHDMITVSWLNLIRRCVRNGETTEETMKELIQYGFDTERRINLGFNHVLTYEDYINSFDTEIDFHEMEGRP